jgi:hypothetical protein
LDVHSASPLKQQSTDRHATALGHIILIPSQPAFALSTFQLVFGRWKSQRWNVPNDHEISEILQYSIHFFRTCSIINKCFLVVDFKPNKYTEIDRLFRTFVFTRIYPIGVFGMVQILLSTVCRLTYICNYLIEYPILFSREKMRNYKSLEAHHNYLNKYFCQLSVDL